jgi:RimJ/RimL family protein N-acetyltransferase
MCEAARESVEQVYPWMQWCHAAYSINDAMSWIDATIAGHRDKTNFEFAIFDDGRFAGGCGINHINHVDKFANVGYWVRTSCAGRGVTPGAVTLLMSWAFARTDLNRLEIVTAVRNTRSQRVAEKVGALREGVLRQRLVAEGRAQDAIMYSVVRT